MMDNKYYSYLLIYKIKFKKKDFISEELEKEIMDFMSTIDNVDVRDIEKNNVDFLLNKGVVLMELGKFQEAVASFDRVLLKNPDNEDAFFLKEECLENL